MFCNLYLLKHKSPNECISLHHTTTEMEMRKIPHRQGLEHRSKYFNIRKDFLLTPTQLWHLGLSYNILSIFPQHRSTQEKNPTLLSLTNICDPAPQLHRKQNLVNDGTTCVVQGRKMNGVVKCALKCQVLWHETDLQVDAATVFLSTRCTYQLARMQTERLYLIPGRQIFPPVLFIQLITAQIHPENSYSISCQ